jgi:hypothetical protein
VRRAISSSQTSIKKKTNPAMNPKSLLSCLLGITFPAIAGLHLASISPAAGATAGLGTAVPAVNDGVQNLNFSTNDATNTNVTGVPSDYVAGDNTNALGQTFTTGANAGGYSLSAISVRQVSWGTTYWDYTGGTITLQIFKLNSFNGSVGSITQLALETATVSGEPDGIGLSSGTPGANAQWLTVTLDSPVVLEANAIYGFQIMSDGTGGNDQFFIETDGTNTNSYAGGFALATGKVGGTTIDSAFVWAGNEGQPSDRAFVATMTGLTEPTNPVFVIQPLPFSGNVGSNVILTATANSSPAPAYQWQYSPDGNAFASLSDAGNVSGTGTNTLTLTSATYSQSGYYRVIADNGTTPATSDEVFVSLSYPNPVISQQPQTAAVAAGGNFNLSVTATGLGNLSYKWFKVDGGGDIELTDGGDISGATTATLQISNVAAADAGGYYVIVSDDAPVADSLLPTTATSATATLIFGDVQVTASATAPATDAYDQSYLPGNVDDVDNIGGTGVSPLDNDASTYASFDRASQGMTFTTGSDPLGYSIQSVTVQMVQVINYLTNGTFYNIQPGDTFEFQFGTVTGGVKTPIFDTNGALYSGTAMVNPAPEANTGAGMYLTFDLATAGIGTLSPNTTYYFEVSSELGGPFFELSGTKVDGYASGTAFRGDTIATIDGNYIELTGDRAFHADLTGLSGPANTYASWISGYPDVGLLTGFNDDPDADGIDNGLENLFGTDPSISNQGITQVAKSGNTVTFQHPANATPASDVTAAYVWSTDLATFHADGATVGDTTVSFTTNTVANVTTVTATITGTVPAKLFTALKAVKVP